MMTVYGYPRSRSTRVLWTLEEAGAEYEFVSVDLAAGAGRKPPFVDLNPGGKVPLLMDAGMVLTESPAICTYIADRFPEAGLVPAPRSPERAHYDRWCFFVATELEQPLWTLVKHRLALPEKYRVAAMADTARWEFSVAARVLSAGLGDNDFLLGERFTVADILAGQTLAWARAEKLPLETSRLEDYAHRVLERPALERARRREGRQEGT